MKLCAVFIVGAVLVASLPAFCIESTPTEKKARIDESSTKRDKAYAPIGAAILTAMGDRHKLALIKPEKEGTDRSMLDLEEWLKKKLGAGTIEVLPPEEVLKCGGVEFAISAEGIGQIAKSCSVPAALYILWKEQDDKTRVSLLLAGSKGETLLNLSLDINKPPPEALPVSSKQTQAPEKSADLATRQEQDKAMDDQVGASGENAPATVSPEEVFLQRKLSINKNQNSWKILQEDKAIGELELAELGGSQKLVAQLNNEISHLKTLRTTAIIMTIGGIAAVGLSAPMLRGESDTLTAGGITLGLGAAIGIAGGVMWWLWGDEATRAGGPDPVRHLLTPEQTRNLVQDYNSSLRKELKIGSEKSSAQKDSKGVSWYFNPGLGGQLSAGLSFVF